MLDPSDFMEIPWRDIAEIHNLLGMRFVPGNVNAGHPIGRSIQRAVEFQESGNYLGRDLELKKLAMLGRQLKAIEQYDARLFRSFKRRIQQTTSDDNNYFGIRQEINVAALLIERQIDFAKSEAPDFIIHSEGKDVFIECASAHLTGPRHGDVSYKIESVMRSKSGKSYCGHRTALFMDVTNVFFNSLINKVSMGNGDLRGYLRTPISSTGFGNATLFFYQLDRDSGDFFSTYLRVDNNAIDATLLGFLNQSFPTGKLVLPRTLVSPDV